MQRLVLKEILITGYRQTHLLAFKSKNMSLEIKNLSKTYFNGVNCFKNINLTVNKTIVGCRILTAATRMSAEYAMKIPHGG